MRKIEGLWWPDDVAERWRHSLRHVKSLDWSLQRLGGRMRTAVQAGGNIGLWPRRMALAGFDRVLTFEPDDISRACLQRNVPSRVEVFAFALGAASGWCAIDRKSLGSHRVIEGKSVDMVTVDSYQLPDVDLLQLDVEGYEWHALSGAKETIRRCKPLIQVELRGFTQKYGKSDLEVHALLLDLGYVMVAEQPGNDLVFEARR